MTSSILENISIRYGLLFFYKKTKDNSIRFKNTILQNEIQRKIKTAKTLLRIKFRGNLSQSNNQD